MSIDPATIGASISAVRDVVKRFSDTTWKSQIVELTDLLMDVQGKAMDLLIELQATKARPRPFPRCLPRPIRERWLQVAPMCSRNMAAEIATLARASARG